MKMLEIKNLSKKYKKGIMANKDINLSLNKGESLGIIGPNGCGKTTLIRQILGLLEPTSGEIIIYNNEGRKLEHKEGLNKIGYVPQYPLYFPSLTVEESLVYPLKILNFHKEKIKNKIEYVYEMTHLGKYRKSYTYTLSGGYLKLLLIMTTIIQEKEILILDEPTAMVDINTKSMIWDILKDIRIDKSIMISSHDIQEIQKNCDNTYFMSNGEFVEYLEGNQFDNMLISNIASIKIVDKMEMEQLKDILMLNNLIFDVTNDVVQIKYKDISELQPVLGKLSILKDVKKIDIEFPSFEKGVENLAKIYSK